MHLYKQDSEYTLGPKYANIPWIWESSQYGKVLNMWALCSALNMAEYALTDFWIYLMFWICQDSECGRVLNMQELHRVLPIYGCVCLNRAWISLNMSEFKIIDRVLNMSQKLHSARSLCKLMSTYWQMGVFRTFSKI